MYSALRASYIRIYESTITRTFSLTYLSLPVPTTQISPNTHSALTASPLGHSDIDKIPADSRDLCLLLLCCGDVETNPGPATGQGQSASSGTGRSGALLEVNIQWEQLRQNMRMVYNVLLPQWIMNEVKYHRGGGGINTSELISCGRSNILSKNEYFVKIKAVTVQLLPDRCFQTD